MHSCQQTILPLLWRNLTIGSDDTFTEITMPLVTSPNSPGAHVRHVKLEPNLYNVEFFAFIQYVPFLVTLRLSYAPHIADISLEHVPRLCPHLTPFYAYGSKMSQVSMVALGQHCLQLSTLKLQHCSHFDPDLFTTLQPCPLQSLTIVQCDLNQLEDPVVAENAALALARFSTLAYLKFEPTGCYSTHFVRDLITNIHAWPDLTYLSLSNCNDVDDTEPEEEPDCDEIIWVGTQCIDDETND